MLLNTENSALQFAEADGVPSISTIVSGEESPAIALNQDSIILILDSWTNIPVMDVGNWTIILRSLAWLSSPRWLLPEATSPSDKKDGVCASRGCGELVDQMCAGSVIRSANLTKILYNFISGEGLLPFSLGDKQLVAVKVGESRLIDDFFHLQSSRWDLLLYQLWRMFFLV